MSLKDLLAELAEYESSAGSVELDLRVDFAELILRQMRRLKLTQASLAHKLGVKESFLSRILHANANCTFSTVARIMHALGVRVRLAEATASDESFSFVNPLKTAMEWTDNAQVEVGWQEKVGPKKEEGEGQEEIPGWIWGASATGRLAQANRPQHSAIVDRPRRVVRAHRRPRDAPILVGTA